MTKHVISSSTVPRCCGLNKVCNGLASVQMKVYLGGTVDGLFLTDVAEELLKKKEMMKIPVLLGLTNHEFGWILPNVTIPPSGQPHGTHL